MSLKNKDLVGKAFEELSNSISDSDKILIETRIFMYRFLSEIDRITKERGINRKELAELAGTSPSYITQLFQGKKIINFQMLTKIKKALDIDFKIETIKPVEKTEKDCSRISVVKTNRGNYSANKAVHETHKAENFIQAKISKPHTPNPLI